MGQRSSGSGRGARGAAGGAVPPREHPRPLAGSIRHLSWSPWRPRTEWGGAAASGWWVHGTPRPATRDSRLSPQPATTAAQPAQGITHTGNTQTDFGQIILWEQAGYVLPSFSKFAQIFRVEFLYIFSLIFY